MVIVLVQQGSIPAASTNYLVILQSDHFRLVGSDPTTRGVKDLYSPGEVFSSRHGWLSRLVGAPHLAGGAFGTMPMIQDPLPWSGW